MNTWRLTLFHLACYYITWLACILSAGAQNAWLGPLIAIPIILSQWFVQKSNHNTRGLWLFIGLTTLLGITIDTTLLNTGLLHFSANSWPGIVSPPWMTALWVSLGMLSFCCFKKYFHHYTYAGILSAIGFPLAYFAGIKLHAASTDTHMLSLSILGVLAGICIPAQLYIFNKLGHQ